MLITIKSPSNEILYNLVENFREILYLCALFIKKEIIDEILQRRSDGVDIVLLLHQIFLIFLMAH